MRRDEMNGAVIDDGVCGGCRWRRSGDSSALWRCRRCRCWGGGRGGEALGCRGAMPERVSQYGLPMPAHQAHVTLLLQQVQLAAGHRGVPPGSVRGWHHLISLPVPHHHPAGGRQRPRSMEGSKGVGGRLRGSVAAAGCWSPLWEHSSGTGHTMQAALNQAGCGGACLHLMVLTSTFHLPPSTL